MRKLIFILIAVATICTPAYCEDEAKDQIFVLDDFSGGLNQKMSQFNLPKNAASIAENIRFNTNLKSISKRRVLTSYGSADNTEPILGMFRHYTYGGDKVLVVAHGDEIEKGNDSTGAFTKILDLASGNHRWQFVSWHDLLIGCDGYNSPIKYDGTSDSATYLGTALATDTDAGTGPASGTRSYKVSYYTTTPVGYEVLYDVPSNTVTCDGDDIDLTMIPIAPDSYGGESVVGRKIYRTKAAGGTWYLLSNGTIANNTAVTLTDSDTDAGLTATTYPAGDATYTPPKGKFALVQNDRLFFANDPQNNPSRVFYSETGDHETFVDDSYLDIRKNDGDTITFMKGVLNLLTIGKNNTIQKIYLDGTTPSTDWSISDPFWGAVGCQAPYSAVESPLGIIYLAREGIYRFTGQYSELISDAVTPVIRDVSPTDFVNTSGIFHENIYYLSYTSTASGDNKNNRVLILDVIDDAYSIDLVDINTFCAFNSGNDWGILYSGSSADGTVFAHSEEVNEINHKRHSDFTGLWDDMRYIPTEAGGNANSPELEIARTETVEELSGIIDSLTGDISRQDGAGNYVSQPVAVGAIANLDKIYWNEVIPITGGDVTVSLRTSATGEKNLLHNDDFELWSNYYADTDTTVRPNDWSFTTSGVGSPSSTKSTTKYRGTYSAKIATDGTVTQAVLARPVDNPTLYAGKTMVFEGWVKSDNSTASKVGISITENENTPNTVWYANSGAWENLNVYSTLSATAATVTVKCVVDTASTADAYFDQVMFIEGTDATNDWTAWSSEFTNPSGSDINTVTSDEYIQYRLSMTTTDIDSTPTMIYGSNYVVKIIFNKEGAETTDDVALRYRTGWNNLKAPNKRKVLKWIYFYYTGTTGTLNLEVENYRGDSQVFEIDLATYPNFYTMGFEGGGFVGQDFRFNITHTGTDDLVIEKLVMDFDIEPRGWDT